MLGFKPFRALFTQIVIAILTLVAWLPWPLKMALGKALGFLALHTLKRRRKITEANVRLAFPDKSFQDQQNLVKAIFRASGIGIMETATALVRDVHFMQDRITFKGREHLDKALAQGRGALVLGIHFSVLDLGGALHNLHYKKVATIYKPHKNPYLDAFICRGRQKHFYRLLPHHNLKKLVACIKQGHAVWYPPDQDFGRSVSVFAPFFGVQAASITMTARIARMTAAPVLPLRIHRNADDFTYTLEYLPPLENFPSGDKVADATVVNQVIEQLIRIHPEQYLWLHRRFKTRPNSDDPSFY